MLTRLKTYLHELASDKKNRLILLPAIATLDLFLPVVLDLTLNHQPFDFFWYHSIGISLQLLACSINLVYGKYFYIFYCGFIVLVCLYWLFFLRLKWLSLPFIALWFLWGGFLFEKATLAGVD